MSTPAEDALLAALTDIESLEVLAKRGLDLDSIPTPSIKQVAKWAIDYYFQSGRRQAPSRELMTQTFGETLDDAGIELPPEDMETDTIESAIDILNDLYADRQWQDWIKVAATEVAAAPRTTKVNAITTVTNVLFEIVHGLQDHTDSVVASEGYKEQLADYLKRKEEGSQVKGLTFGFPAIDNHTFGIHEGELAILAAGPKIGKSYMLDKIALHEWAVKGRIVCLHTLENSVHMTLGRIICMHLGLSPRQWQRGTLPDEQVERVEKFIATEMDDMPGRLHVISPPLGRRTPEMLVREAKMHGAKSHLVDQLTHVEHPNPGRKPRHELFNENVHEFKALASTGRDKVALVLAHQINREGVKASKKVGYLEMTHLAESSGVERGADWVFGMSQTDFLRSQRAMLFQVLAARREDTKNWEMLWDPETNGSRVMREVTFTS